VQSDITLMNPRLVIRHALPADAQNISVLIHGEAHHCTTDPFGKGAECFFSTISPEAVNGYTANPDFIYLLGFVEAELAGVVAIRGGKHLYHLFVAAKFQRSGIASCLWQHARTRALESGNTEGFTVNATLFAIPFYQRFGFQIQGAQVEDKGVVFIPMKLMPDINPNPRPEQYAAAMPPTKRALAYRRFGADDGRLVVYFHGSPGAPEECAVFDQYGTEHKLTFISHERFSIDPKLKGAAYYQHLADAIADRAAGKTVDLIGFSIGGFIALQVCRLMGNRVRSLHLVSAAAPLDAGNFIDRAAGKSVFRLAQNHPFAFHLLVRLQGLSAAVCPGLWFRMMFASAAGEDKVLAIDDKFQAGIGEILKLCFTRHASGYARDIRAYVQTWKDTLADIGVTTSIWHGAEDNWSPVAMAEYLASAIPGCASTEIFNRLSHYSCLYQAAPEICRQLNEEVFENLPVITVPPRKFRPLTIRPKDQL
jgi:pimeloyl-ACP methyl ester carboxylesterase/GNAT superfamily N-acetyltransferase